MLGALAIGKWVNALIGLHASNGFTTGKGTFKHLQQALLQWSRVQAEAKTKATSGIEAISKVCSLASGACQRLQ